MVFGVFCFVELIACRIFASLLGLGLLFCFLSPVFKLEYRSNFGDGVDWRTRVGDISPLFEEPELLANLDDALVLPFPALGGRNLLLFTSVTGGGRFEFTVV